MVVHLAPTSYRGLSFTGRAEALDWLFAEAQCLLACARQQTTGSGLGRAVDLLWAAKDLAESGANAKQYETAAMALRDAAQEDTDVRAESRARTALSNVHLAAGRYSEADEEARCAVALAAAAGDGAPISWASTDRGIIALSQGRYEEAEEFLTTARDGYRADGNRPGEASALCNLSRLYERMNRTSDAVTLAQQGVNIFQQLGLTLRLANGRYALGVALIQAGRLSEGLVQLTDALVMFGNNRQRLWEGTAHFRIAQLHLAARRPAQAAQHAEQALATGFIGGDLIRGSVLNTLGKSLHALGQLDRARACWHEALLLLEQSGAPEASEVRLLLAPLDAP
jgi:tetratricopeptide (TPR) repeat protein